MPAATMTSTTPVLGMILHGKLVKVALLYNFTIDNTYNQSCVFHCYSPSLNHFVHHRSPQSGKLSDNSAAIPPPANAIFLEVSISVNNLHISNVLKNANAPKRGNHRPHNIHSSM
jgi:hypothetical protein